MTCSFCICMSHVFNFGKYFDTPNILPCCLWTMPHPIQSHWNLLLIAGFNAVWAPWDTFLIMLVPKEVFSGKKKKKLNTSASAQENCRKTSWNYSHKIRNWCSFLSCYCSLSINQEDGIKNLCFRDPEQTDSRWALLSC